MCTLFPHLLPGSFRGVAALVALGWIVGAVPSAIAGVPVTSSSTAETRATTSQAAWKRRDEEFWTRCDNANTIRVFAERNNASFRAAYQFAMHVHALGKKKRYLEILGEPAPARPAPAGASAPVFRQERLNLPPMSQPASAAASSLPAKLQDFDKILKESLGETDIDYIRWKLDLADAVAARSGFGDQFTAETLYAEALTEAQKLLAGHENPWYAQILVQLAQAQLPNNKPAEAIANLQRALGILSRTEDDGRLGAASILQYQGVVAQHCGGYEEADQYFQEALRIYQGAAGEQARVGAATLHGNLAAIAGSKRDYPEARRQLRMAMEEYGPEKTDDPQDAAIRALLLLQLGLMPMLEGSQDAVRLQESEKSLAEACAIMERKEVAGPDNPRLAMFLVKRAAFLSYRASAQAGDRENARLLMARAAKIMSANAVDEARPEQYVFLLESGYASLYAGETQQAARIAGQALAAAKKSYGEETPIQTEPLSLLGLCEMIMGHRDSAGRFLLESRQRGKADCDAAFEALGEVAQLHAIRQFRMYLDRDLSFRSRSGLLDTIAYQGVLEWKGTVLVHQRGRRGGRVERATPADIQRALPEGTALVDILEYGHLDPPEWITQARYLAFVVRRDGIEPVELGDAAPIDEAIQLWRRNDAFPRDQGRKLRDMVWEKIQPHLHGARVVLISPDGGALAGLPWGALPARRVVKASNGPEAAESLIASIVFATIPAPQLLPELIGSDGRAGAPARPSLLAVGDISYDAKPGSESGQTGPLDKLTTGPFDKPRTSFPRSVALRGSGKAHFENLEFAADEMNAVERLFADHFGKPDQLRGPRATAQEFIAQAPGHRWIHIISHGFFAPAGIRSAMSPSTSLAQSMKLDGQDSAGEPDPRLLSGLALYGANNGTSLDSVTGQPRDDGILTARDVSQMNLTGTDLVVLSSCQSGLGEAVGGEGLLGLQRAFEVAGARSVIASLCSVDDALTTRLMAEFYRQMLDAHLPPLLALRQAQLKLMRGDAATAQSRGPVEGAPGHRIAASPAWAAWTFSGDPGDLKTILARMDERSGTEQQIPATPAVRSSGRRGWIVAAGVAVLLFVLVTIWICRARIVRSSF
jgi:tetratricopeptide (TPR) repeat protein